MSSRLGVLFVLLALAGAAGANAQARCEPPPAAAPAPPDTPRGKANAARAAVEAGELTGVDTELEALARAASQQPPAEAAHLEIHLARTWQKLGTREPARAVAAAQRAAALLQQADARAAQAGDARLRSYAQGYLGELYAAGGRADDALTLTRRALYEASRANAPDALYRWQWQLGRLAHARGDDDAAIAAYRDALKTLSLLRADLALASAQESFAFRSEVEPAYVELVDLLLQRASQGDAEARQALLAEARDALESLKAAELRDYFRDACLDAQRRTAPEQVPGAVVLYPVLLPDRVELIVGTAGGLSLFRAPVDGPTLAAEALRLRGLLTKRTTHQYLPLSAQLYDWLIRPAKAALVGPAVSALVVVPSGALRTIPFAALRDGQANEFLIEQVPVAISPGLTLTDPRPIARARATGLAAGISKSVQGYEPLPAVPEEIADVSSAFPGVALLDEQFLASRFEEEVATRPIDVLHVASHGEFRGEADESFILTWDTRISMDRLAALVGRTRLRTERPLEMLVLSACQTAAGDERAALGLAGVALQAGARSAVATLWSVNDEAAKRIIERFYGELAGGASRAQALQRAQRSLIETPAFRHPAYWSPFLLISSWL